MTSALNTNFDAIGNLFGKSTVGVAVKLFDAVDGFIRTDGSIPAQTKSLSDTLEEIEADKVKLEARLTDLEETLTKRFTALDVLVGGLQATASQLSQQLNSFVDPLSFKK